MKYFMSRILPRTMAGQLIALLIVVLLIGQFINLAIIIGERRIQLRSFQYRNIISETVAHINNVPPYADRDIPFSVPQNEKMPGTYFITRYNRASTMPNAHRLEKYEKQFEDNLRAAGIEPLSVMIMRQEKMVPNKRPPPPPRQSGKRFRRDRPDFGRPLDRRPDGPRGFRPPRLDGKGQPGMQVLILSAEIHPGIWFNAQVPHYALSAITTRLLSATAILLGLTVLAVWIFARRITRPLSELTQATDQLGRGENVQELNEYGPEDIKKAASSFNTMRERLTRVMDTQRTMLRAVGHDLRTPLTALRIRAENIPEDAGREKFIATLDDMKIITEEILSWSKDISGLEENAAVDLEALLSSLVDDFQDQGKDVKLAECAPLIANIRRVSLKRAVQNLIDNGVKYGKSVRVSVEHKNERITIHIDDDGPGIPAGKIDEVKKPFVRLEVSRSKQTGGTGLGLSIAETIIQVSGGRLELSNRNGGGLRASIILPDTSI